MKKVLAPMWCPPEPSYAGGFYRAKRILESMVAWRPYAVASDTFDVTVQNFRRYPTRALKTSSSPFFKPMRAVNWAWSTLAIVVLGLSWREKFDLVYASPSEILPISLGALIVGKLRRIPVVLCNQNVRDTEFWMVNRLVHAGADAIITVSESLAAELRAEGLRVPILVGTNGVDDFSVPAREKRFEGIFVGRHTEAKGIFDLLQAWRLVCDVRPGARLACVGPITPRRAKRIASTLRALRLEGNVELFGPVTEREKWELYAYSRVCVFPSHVEGWGIVPVEAQLAGLPVVAYDLRAYAQTIATSRAARLVPVADIAAFAQATLQVLSENSDPHATKEWARRFTWRSAADREESLLQIALDRTAHG